MTQNIKPIDRSTDMVSDKLFDKCMDRLTGRDELLASLDGVIAITSNPNPNPFEQLMKEVRAMPRKFEPAPFDMQPFEWPQLLDRSCMVRLDNINVP